MQDPEILSQKMREAESIYKRLSSRVHNPPPRVVVRRSPAQAPTSAVLPSMPPDASSTARCRDPTNRTLRTVMTVLAE